MGCRERGSRPEARGVEPYCLGPTRWSRGRKDWEGCLLVCNEVLQSAMKTLGSLHQVLIAHAPGETASARQMVQLTHVQLRMLLWILQINFATLPSLPTLIPLCILSREEF